ncbi:ubiquilin [Nematocida sp. AWRm80]|nr:ubiquilin [Nematocida sp. AWRm80]
MNISVRTSKGQEYIIELENEDQTIEDLKNKLVEQLSVAKEKIKLIYSGKLLKDDQTLKSYGLQDKSVVHLVIPNSTPKKSPTEQPQSTASTASASSTGAGSASGGSTGAGTGASAGYSGQNGPFGGNLFGFRGQPGAGEGQPANNAAFMDSWMAAQQLSMQNPEEMSRRMKEIMNDPERSKALLEASMVLSNVPEETKVAVRESMNNIAEMAKSDPEQFNNTISQLMQFADPALMRSFQPPTQSATGPLGHPQGTPGASAMPTPDSIMCTMPFNEQEANEKYKTKLEELEGMGCTNKKLNLIALVYSEGDLTKALNLIFDWSDDQK